MPEESPTPKSAGLGCAVHVLICAVYFLANFMSLKLSFIPGLDTVILWTFVLPGFGILLAWVKLGSKRQQIEEWMIVAIFYTLFLSCCGFLSLYVIAHLTASV